MNEDRKVEGPGGVQRMKGVVKRKVGKTYRRVNEKIRRKVRQNYLKRIKKFGRG